MLREFRGPFWGPVFEAFTKEICISTAQNRVPEELQIGQILSVCLLLLLLLLCVIFFWTTFQDPQYRYECNFMKITLQKEGFERYSEGKVADFGTNTDPSVTLPC